MLYEVITECPLHALTGRYFAHDEAGIEAAVTLGDHHAFIGLQTLARTFLDLDLNDDGVPRSSYNFV